MWKHCGQMLSTDVINCLPHQVFSTDTFPDFAASSVSLCQARCKQNMRTYVVEKQRSEQKEQVREASGADMRARGGEPYPRNYGGGTFSSDLLELSFPRFVDSSNVAEMDEMMAEPILAATCVAAQQGGRWSGRESG